MHENTLEIILIEDNPADVAVSVAYTMKARQHA